MEFMDVMEIITQVVTVIMFMCGIPPMLSMYKTRDTKNVPYLMFLLSAISCSGMCHYGHILGNFTLVWLNFVGLVLNWIYTLMYCMLVREKSRALMLLLAGIIYMCGLYYYFELHGMDQIAQAQILGAHASSICMVILTMPALEIIDNLKHKHSDGTPLVMLIGSMACSSSWLIYGLMLDDANVYRPNVPGLVVMTAKMYVVFMYSGDVEKKLKAS